MSEAVALMAQRKISELPVVDGDGRPVGLIDVTDVVGLFPQKAEGEPAKASRPEGWGIVGGGVVIAAIIPKNSPANWNSPLRSANMGKSRRSAPLLAASQRECLAPVGN